MEKLTSYTFNESNAKKSEYDWDTLLDGGIYKLVSGEDFKCKPGSFRTIATNAAKKLGKGVRINKVEGGLVIQAYPLPAEEVAEPTEPTEENSAPTDEPKPEPESPPAPEPPPAEAPKPHRKRR
jgi:hypothetical protein